MAMQTQQQYSSSSSPQHQPTQEELRALLARSAWRLWPLALNPSGPAIEQTRPFFELIAAVVDPDRTMDVVASAEALTTNPYSDVVRALISERSVTVDSMRAILERLPEPYYGLTLFELDQDLEFSASIQDQDPAVAAATMMERPLWHDVGDGSWLELWMSAAGAIAHVDRDAAVCIDAIRSAGPEPWQHVWRYVRVDRPRVRNVDVPLWMLSDEPVSDTQADLFGFADYASAIYAFITDPRTGTPLTLAINGPWGCGKSSLARLVQSNLKALHAEGSRKTHITCWFNAWMHDDAKDMAAAFASAIAQAADAHRPRWKRYISPIPTELLTGRRHTKRKLVRWSIALIATGFIAFFINKYASVGASGIQFSVESPQAVITMLIGFGGLLLQLMQRFTESAKTVSAFVNDPNSVAQKGSISQVRNQLNRLIKSATHGGRRFVIFVDDVERCRPPRAVDLLEVVNQLLSHEGVVTIVLADLPAVAAAAEIKYQDLVKVYAAQGTANGRPTAAQTYGRMYLQKIIQLEFDVPAHRRESITQFIGGVAREKEPVPSTPDVKQKPAVRKVDPVAQTRRLRALIDSQIREGNYNPKVLKQAVGDIHGVDRRVVEQLISERLIRRVTASDSEVWRAAVEEATRWVPPFPRHAKRLVNRMRLLLGIMLNRGGFATDPVTKARAVGKWVVLWERWPEISQQTLRDPQWIGELETAAAGGAQKFNDVVVTAAAQYRDDEDLLDFFCSEPKLAALIETIVHLGPSRV